MNRTKWAIFIAMAGGTFAATAYAETKQSPFTPSAYEYGNYDYYSQISAPAAQAPPTVGALFPPLQRLPQQIIAFRTISNLSPKITKTQ